MDRMLYKMETLLLMVSANRPEWLQHASNEVEQATQELGAAKLHTEVLINAVAEQWNLPTPSTLANLVEGCAHPTWGELLGAHLAEVRNLEERIRAAATAARQYTTQGLISAQEAMAAAGLRTDAQNQTRILDTAL